MLFLQFVKNTDINSYSAREKHRWSFKNNRIYQRVICTTFKTFFWHTFCGVISRAF